MGEGDSPPNQENQPTAAAAVAAAASQNALAGNGDDNGLVRWDVFYSTLHKIAQTEVSKKSVKSKNYSDLNNKFELSINFNKQ